MALTLSKMLELNTPLPSFEAWDVTGKKNFVSDEWTGSKAYFVMFICNHCPYVQHILPGLTKLYQDYASREVAFLAINSNDVEAYPQDAPNHMASLASNQGWQFPFLLDETQDIARTFLAACTPDFYLFDKNRKLFYRGQIDGARPESDVENDARDIRKAFDACLQNLEAPAEQKPSVGCSIKWKK